MYLVALYHYHHQTNSNQHRLSKTSLTRNCTMSLSRSHQFQVPTYPTYLISQFSRPVMYQREVCTGSKDTTRTGANHRPIVTQKKGQEGLIRGAFWGRTSCLIHPITTLSVPTTTPALLLRVNLMMAMLLKLNNVLNLIPILSTLDVC